MKRKNIPTGGTGIKTIHYPDCNGRSRRNWEMTNSTETLNSTPVEMRVACIDKQQKSQIDTYYREAGPDYETWSKAFNMHYGYFRKGMNPFHREPMLNQMTQEVFNRLELDPDKGPAIWDVGLALR